MHRVRAALAGAAALAVLAGAGAGASPASARIVEIGKLATDATPSCPASPCQAVSRTTGYQAKVGDQRGVFAIPERGRIVAWSITLGNPGRAQRQFFDERLGGAASAGISIMRPGRTLAARVIAVTPIMPLQDYFGTTVQFPLEQTIAVEKGWIVALTVPTWAPALALGLPGTTSWRASRRNRPRSECQNTEKQTAQTQPGGVTRFLCLYRTARLTYSATLITDPAATASPTPTATATPTATPTR
jgi:hypothetical protein